MLAPVIETERLTLRPFHDGDVKPFVDAVFSNPKVMATLTHNPRTPEEQASCAREYIDSYTSAWPEYGYGGWVVCSRSNALASKNTLLGFCGFDLGKREGKLPELGYGYSESCWGVGVGYEAAIAVVDWFFRRGKFKEFYACTDSFNTGSIRILEKLGMRYHGAEDLWDSVAKGEGLVPVYLLDREMYLTDKKVS